MRHAIGCAMWLRSWKSREQKTSVHLSEWLKSHLDVRSMSARPPSTRKLPVGDTKSFCGSMTKRQESAGGVKASLRRTCAPLCRTLS